MLKKLALTFALSIFIFGSLAVAEELEIPKDHPAAKVNVPSSWKPEETDHGYAIESPDQVATVFLEVTSLKGVDKLLDESIDWLVTEQKVKVDAASKKDSDFELEGRKWGRVSWDADSKEWGPSVVGFLFTEVGRGKVLTVTYWITKKDNDKHMPTLEKIFASVKPVED
jgi:hypothetical protein